MKQRRRSPRGYGFAAVLLLLAGEGRGAPWPPSGEVSIEFLVRDQITGDPIAGAVVRAGGLEGRAEGRTDQGGIVTLEGTLAADETAIHPLIAAEGYALAQVEVVLSGEIRTVTKEVFLQPLTARVRGQVRVGEEGAGDLEVGFWSQGRVLDERHVTRAVKPLGDGSFELRVPAGAPCHVLVRRKWRLVARVEVGGGKPLDPFRGTVVEGAREEGRVYELPGIIEVSQRDDIVLDERVFEVLDDARPYRAGRWDLANGEWYPCDLPVEVRHRESGIVMRLVPAGWFWMGASPGDDMAYEDEKPRHLVEITRPFYLGKTEVTWEEWERNRGDLRAPQRPEWAREDRMPVVNVSWEDCEAFCNGLGLRLPTEAEWEYAARAGVATRYPWGDDPPAEQGWANVRDRSLGAEDPALARGGFPFDDGFAYVAPAGSFRPNALGLHDMIGNVGEWCLDRYEQGFPRNPLGTVIDVDPFGRPGFGRVVRGGSWFSVPRVSRLSFRVRYVPTVRLDGLGCRVASDP